MDKYICFIGALALLAFPSWSIAAGPGNDSLTKYNIRIGNCNATSVTAKWRLDSIMGEATVNGSYKWKGDSGCTLPSSTVIWLKVANGQGAYGYVKLAPVTPKANRGFGYDTTGSPSWRAFLCGYN